MIVERDGKRQAASLIPSHSYKVGDFIYFQMEIILLGILGFIQTTVGLTPDGCLNSWIHFNNYCYQFHTTGQNEVHFDTAKGICITKGATLVTLWKKAEFDFVTDNLKKMIGDNDSAWIGLTPSENKKWIWIDGSYFDLNIEEWQSVKSEEAALHQKGSSTSDLCATITTTGEISFKDCDQALSAFVCKKPLDMLYLPSTYASQGMSDMESDPGALLFERWWPPLLDGISLSNLPELATVDVNHETDCAYRCFAVENCRAFLLHCISSRKCNGYQCTLLSDVIKI